MLFTPARVKKINPIAVSVLIFAIGLGMTFAAWKYNSAIFRFQAENVFATDTLQVRNTLSQKADRATEILHAAAVGLASTHSQAGHEDERLAEFSNSVDLPSTFPSLVGMHFVKKGVMPDTALGAVRNTFTISVPVYDSAHALTGTLVGTFSVGSFLSDVVASGSPYQAIRFRIASVLDGTETTLYDTKPTQSAWPSELLKKDTVSISGTVWMITADADPRDLMGTTAARFPEYLALAGIVGSFAIFIVALSLLTARRRAGDIAELMTESLKERTDELEVTKDHIEREKRKLEAILSSMGEGLIAVSDSGKIMLINQSAQAALGSTEQEEMGKSVEDVLKLEREGKPMPREEYPVYKVIENGGVVRVYIHENVTFKDAYGQVFPVVLSAISLSGKKSKAGGISAIMVFRDVSLEKAVEEAKTEFVSLAAHQLRMPLTTIRWYAEMLMSGDGGKLTEQQHSYVDEIFQSNRRMVNLVNQLLSVSRVRLGTFKIEPVPTDMNAVAESVIAELKPDITKKNMTIVKTYKPDIEKLNADPSLIRVILQNLLSNAIKYTPENGTVTLSFTVGTEFVMKVTDTGYGIPLADQARIFTQLYRADNIKGKDVAGTGLGLYMVKTIIDQSGGTISFSSKENEGTTFVVTFPRSGMKAKEGTKSLF